MQVNIGDTDLIPGFDLCCALEEGTAAHPSILAWRIPRRRSLAGYGLFKELDMTEANEHSCMQYIIFSSLDFAAISIGP